MSTNWSIKDHTLRRAGIKILREVKYYQQVTGLETIIEVAVVKRLIKEVLINGTIKSYQ